MEVKKCSCSESDQEFFDEIRTHVEEFKAVVRPEDRTAEDEYRYRLTRCKECPGLYYGTTCRYCGCIVEVRALRRNKDCPSPDGSRWKNT